MPKNTQPNFPVALELFEEGSFGLFCSEACLDRFESDWMPGIRLRLQADVAPGSSNCGACIGCGDTCRPCDDCDLHEGTCPPTQWLLTMECAALIKEASEIYDFDRVSELLDIIDRVGKKRPGTSPWLVFDMLRGSGF